MRNLGVAYDKGVGVNKSPEKALQWFRRAAEAGDASSQVVLGRACYEGKGVPKNLADAVFWLLLAASADATPHGISIGDNSETVLREGRYLLREVELFASPEEMAEAKARVEEFKAKRISKPDVQKTPAIPGRGVREDDSPAPK